MSREHLVFKVEEYTEEDAVCAIHDYPTMELILVAKANPQKVPSLTVQNPTTASRKHKREGKPDAAIAAEGSGELRHGDAIYALHNVVLT